MANGFTKRLGFILIFICKGILCLISFVVKALWIFVREIWLLGVWLLSGNYPDASSEVDFLDRILLWPFNAVARR